MRLHVLDGLAADEERVAVIVLLLAFSEGLAALMAALDGVAVALGEVE